MKLNTVIGKVVSIVEKMGDRSASTIVIHVTMDNELTFTATRQLDYVLKSEHFPAPSEGAKKVPLNTTGVLFFGSTNGYRYNTFVGFVPIEDTPENRYLAEGVECSCHE